ncbi:hypothetical protein IAD21_00310 [Abditibacteriota bacterium]|nr:hypothetical protein IAD21_00310 [Abditibacteriota bacterium]
MVTKVVTCSINCAIHINITYFCLTTYERAAQRRTLSTSLSYLFMSKPHLSTTGLTSPLVSFRGVKNFRQRLHSPHDVDMPKVGEYDPILAPYLNASDKSREERALEELVQSIEGSVHAILRRKVSVLASDTEQEDDLYATTILRVLECLYRFKTQLTQGRVNKADIHLEAESEIWEEDSEGQSKGKATITNFKAMAETIARNAVHEHIRSKYPKRASLQNQVLYIIRHAKGNTGQSNFALWRYEFERLCGFARWMGQPVELTERHLLMRDTPGSLARLVLPTHDATTLKLPHLMDLLFSWLASPAEFDDMVGATARLRGVCDVAPVSLSEFGSSESKYSETPRYEPPAPELTPEQYTVLRASLRPLWEQITALTRLRSASLLFNQADTQGRSVIELLIELGVASLSEIATVLGLTPIKLAELLPQLPLKDKRIAELLGCAPASIAVYRAQARKKLQENTE